MNQQIFDQIAARRCNRMRSERAQAQPPLRASYKEPRGLGRHLAPEATPAPLQT